MKRSWTALAVSLFVIGVLAGCGNTNNSVQYNTGATLVSISPSSISAGTPASPAMCQDTTTSPRYPCFTLYVLASNSNPFNSTGKQPVVEWNGQKRPTTYVDSTDVYATIPYSYVAKAGSVSVLTYQPQSGSGQNGLSNPLTFIIYGAPNPYPSLSSVSPTSAPYCAATNSNCSSVSITLTGSNFLPVSQDGGSSVTITGASTYDEETAITVNSISSTQLKATIPGTALCATGPVQVNVINPPSAICIVNCPNLGGGDTNNPPSGEQATTQLFTITGSSANTCPANVPPTITVRKALETPAISRDGRYVTYASAQNGTTQILVRDTCLGPTKDCVPSTRTVSVSSEGAVGNSDSDNAVMTPDGRYIAFSSAARNLVDSPSPGREIYLRDTCIGATGSCQPSTLLVATDEEGQLRGTESILPSISASGRFVAFLAQTPRPAANLASATHTVAVPAGNSGLRQVFVRDTCLGATHCSPKTMRISSPSASVSSGAALAEEAPAISSDGRFVSYASTQSGSLQILLTDTCLGAGSDCTTSTRAVSAAGDGAVGNGDSHNAVMTADGRYVAFSSAATNLVEEVPAGRQTYLRDTCVGAATSCKPTTFLVSIDAHGQLTGTEAILPSLSTTGRYVAFLAVTSSQAATSALAPNSGLRQIFVRDTCLAAPNCTPKTTRISLQPGDVSADLANPSGPALAGLARQIAITDSKSATVFTPTVPIDDRVFLAIPDETK
jgi:Tol biopolymer transport system component